MKLRWSYDEVLSAKSFAREFPRALDGLRDGDTDFFVVTRHGEPHGVLLRVERYEALLEAEQGLQARVDRDEELLRENQDLRARIDRDEEMRKDRRDLRNRVDRFEELLQTATLGR